MCEILVANVNFTITHFVFGQLTVWDVSGAIVLNEIQRVQSHDRNATTSFYMYIPFFRMELSGTIDKNYRVQRILKIMFYNKIHF